MERKCTTNVLWDLYIGADIILFKGWVWFIFVDVMFIYVYLDFQKNLKNLNLCIWTFIVPYINEDNPATDSGGGDDDLTGCSCHGIPTQSALCGGSRLLRGC